MRPLSACLSSRRSFCFIVSINFLSSSIDNWFSIRIGDALNRTLEIAQLYYQQSADQAKYYARQLSADISKNGLYEGEKFLYLKALVERRHKSYKLNMLEVHIENQKDNVVIRDQEHPRVVPKPLSPKSLEDLYVGKEVTTIEQEGGGDMIRGVVPVYSQATPKVIIGFVMASYYFPDGLVDKISVIAKTSEEYRQLTLLKTPIKFGYIITLFIVMLLIIFSATWFGLYLAKGITVPIQDLAEATTEDRPGRPEPSDRYRCRRRDRGAWRFFQPDDQGPQTEQTGAGAGECGSGTATEVYGNHPAQRLGRRHFRGRNGVITTINRAAERMLGIQTHKVLNRRFDEVLIPDHLRLAEEVLREMRERGEGFIEKQIDLTLRDRAMTILMTITVIRDDEGNNMGMAVVFEDLTHLQRAERAAAWREVARRMAHEIKNPLTPVKLSAQRLQKKYGDRMGDDDAVFQECTKTIIDQVDVLKNLVNEFSRYARLPVTTLALQ